MCQVCCWYPPSWPSNPLCSQLSWWAHCWEILFSLQSYSDYLCILCVVFLYFWYHKSFHPKWKQLLGMITLDKRLTQFLQFPAVDFSGRCDAQTLISWRIFPHVWFLLGFNTKGIEWQQILTLKVPAISASVFYSAQHIAQRAPNHEHFLAVTEMATKTNYGPTRLQEILIPRNQVFLEHVVFPLPNSSLCL